MVGTIFKYLGVLGLGSIIGIITKHLLDKDRERGKQILEIKVRAYTKAISALSGLGDKTVHFVTSNSSEGEISSIKVLEYLTNLTEEIAPALLVADKSLRILLEKIRIVVSNFVEIIEDCLGGVRKHGGQYIIDSSQEEAKELANWAKKLKELEKQISSEMQKEIRLP